MWDTIAGTHPSKPSGELPCDLGKRWEWSPMGLDHKDQNDRAFQLARCTGLFFLCCLLVIAHSITCPHVSITVSRHQQQPRVTSPHLKRQLNGIISACQLHQRQRVPAQYKATSMIACPRFGGNGNRESPCCSRDEATTVSPHVSSHNDGVSSHRHRWK